MKITFNSPVILGFSFLCVVVFVLTQYLNTGMNWFTLPASFDFSNWTYYPRLFTYVLGHANADHLIGNLSFILLLGPIIEEKYGAKHIMIMLFTTALVTAVFHILFFKNGLVGASGIVFCFIVLVSLVNFKNNELPLTFILVAIIFIGKELIYLFSDDNISQFAHIIGGCIGAFFGFKLKSKGRSSKTSSGRDILKGLK
ncbi:MAG: rhomboid family intramembrane serine protease [Putridiphycobacter sp.]|nr:rhomboid family intramembrane serine protease [Putridiphycobacter sp.]